MQTTNCATTIALVDDHPLVLNGLKQTLAELPGIRVVGAFSCPRKLMALLRATPVDIVILDYALGINEPPTVELIRKIHHDHSSRVVIYSAVQGTLIQRACLDQGAFRFVQKRQSMTDLIAAVCACMEAGPRLGGVCPSPG
jgi:DNA-binding NarL/FixJ family response regulator